ncbi:hypothetical protein H310_01439 [Aphanomyces invadans]|uniref:Uncharacterized protein n=1 Tax=Aphanomyces invadans TaxID=157072 RepID=A0A024URB1_9STRA|nr:hypothetical protein H310_01439 [Aphanomyces invadans]ETW08961.1 hypothetical protein H310_01439 [Aphanomyces invadans]|eukprot:XP_008862766.1 hypothetical protein H310_01439 [Aphanomyces invadans]
MRSKSTGFGQIMTRTTQYTYSKTMPGRTFPLTTLVLPLPSLLVVGRSS